jgi:Zn-finger nucleic acid-binding protein
LACPECHGPLTPQRVEGIEIDRCVHCVGVWLDAGEYDAVRRHIEHAHSIGSVQQDSEDSTGTKGESALGFGFEILMGLAEIFFV